MTFSTACDDEMPALTPIPRVSVVLPVFNAERFIAVAVESILGQTLSDLELIAIDDGSTDHTRAILMDRARADARLRVTSRPNRGLTRTLNEGIGLARAAYVAIMNADDVALPTRLEKQVAYLDAHPQVAAVGSATRTFAETGTRKVSATLPADPAAVRALMATRCPFAHPTVMFRRHAVVDVGWYRPQMEPAEDYDLWLRLAERHDLANLEEPLLEYRLHAGQATARAFERVAAATLVARMSAEARRAGRVDPAATLEVIDDAVLERMGIAAADLARATIDVALGRAETLLAAGCSATAAREPVTCLRDSPTARNQPRLFTAAKRWLEGRILVDEGRYAPAVPKFLEAALADQSFRTRLIRAIGRRAFGRA